MKIGMMYFDNDKSKSVEQRVKEAAEFYQKKYHKAPTLCFVHPTLQPVSDKPVISAGVEIRSSRTILVNSFWIGNGD